MNFEKKKTNDKEKQHKTPLVLTYNRILPSISNNFRKHWNIFNIRRTLQGLFQEEPITTFKINRNLKELIRSNRIEKGKVEQVKNTFTIAKCSPCLSNTGNLCCSQWTSASRLSLNKQKEHLKFIVKLTAKVNTLLTEMRTM